VQITRLRSVGKKSREPTLLQQSKLSKRREICRVAAIGDLEAQEVGNPNQGLRLAHTLCAECHLVDKLPGQQSPNLIAPTFEQIANTPGMNSAALTAALRTSHESMPNIIIKGSDLSDVIAYILSLTKRR
jgi:mono/diheme cytochrome c family protein